MTDNNSTEFKPSFYARVPVQQLTPQEMDSLLTNGYYRNGLDACANSVRFMGNAWVSAVMLRVRLSDFVWKKRLRKLLRSNGEKFSFHFQLFESSVEKEALWQQFKQGVHGWAIVPKLEMHLLRGQPATSFNTWELCVFFESKLVAISVFDRGERGITSLEAAYDTAFNKYSLGVYTMLLEIEHCIEHGIDFYYPGFFPKGDPMFDYKLRQPGVLPGGKRRVAALGTTLRQRLEAGRAGGAAPGAEIGASGSGNCFYRRIQPQFSPSIRQASLDRQ